MGNVENRISHQLQETIHCVADKKPLADLEQNNLNLLQDQIRDYRSEMIHSKQQLEKLENTFSDKLNAMQLRNEESGYKVQNEEKLAELDAKYSKIQGAIGNLQQMITNEYKTKESSPKKKTKKKVECKKPIKSNKMRRSVFAEDSTSLSEDSSSILLHRMSTHLTPHLSDLDNLVQCVMETDKIDRSYSKKKTKKCVDCPPNKKKSVKRKRVKKNVRKSVWA